MYRLEMELSHHQPLLDSAHVVFPQPEQVSSVMSSSGKGKGKRLRDWEVAETSALLECVNLPEFRHQKRNQSYMKWDVIAEETLKRLVAAGSAITDSAITGKRCKERMKTLKGYYQQVQSKKKKAGVTEDEWHKSNGLAVNWWHTAIGNFRGPREGKSTKDERKASEHHIAQQFNSLNSAQRLTLLHLYFVANNIWFGLSGIFDKGFFLSNICRLLSSLQNRKELMICKDVIALQRKGLVMWVSDDDEELIESTDMSIDFDRLLEHERFFEKVMERNPIYNAFQHLHNVPMVTFDASCAPLGTTYLCLSTCKELEVVDLSGFKNLRVLHIRHCPLLYKVIGCGDSFNQLRWLEICYCPSYDGYSSLWIFPYLQEFRHWPCNSGLRDNYQHGVGGGALDVSGCVYLRTLYIQQNATLSSTLGLEGLHSLIELKLEGCKALQNLPDIGHMKHLTYLSIKLTAVEEIKGIEKLWSLEQLDCRYSKLKTLGDLTHLPHLDVVYVQGCPVTKDPSSPYFGKDWVNFNHKIEDVDVSDVSETYQNVSCEGS